MRSTFPKGLNEEHISLAIGIGKLLAVPMLLVFVAFLVSRFVQA